MPGPADIKAALPLATGAYSWWPCAPAVALAGLIAMRGTAVRLGVVFLVSFIPFILFYEAIEVGRYFDFGYGPRYELPLVVPMAVGTGVALAPVWHAARARWSARSAFGAGGPAALAAVAIVAGVVRIAPLVY